MNDPTLLLLDSLASQIVSRLFSLDLLLEFQACRRLLENHITDMRAWQVSLPYLACRAAGGTHEDGITVAAAWLPMNYASELLDEVEDQELETDDDKTSPEIATNLGTSLIFLSFHILTLIQSQGGAARATSVFSRLGYNATRGQHQDLSALRMPVEDALTNYWETVILKAGSVFRMAAQGGAAAGTSDTAIANALGDYGTALGVILQVIDDCVDAFPSLDNNDRPQIWEVSLPLLLYLLKTGETEIAFPQIGSRAEWVALLQEAQIAELVSSVLLDWKNRAQESLSSLGNTPEKQELEMLLFLCLKII